MNLNSTSPDTSTALLCDPTLSDKHCVFRCGESWFSVPAVCVREISILPGLVRVPNCDPTLAGMCHLRSEFIPVISLPTLLSNDSTDTNESHDKLMVIQGVPVWALLIAEAAALELLETIISPVARQDDGIPGSPVMGTAMYREQIIRVLDPNATFALAQKALSDQWNGRQNSISQKTQSTKGSQR